MIRISFYTPSVMLSTELQDIIVQTDHDYIDFELLADASPLLSGRYYALDGRVQIADVSSLIEEYMAGNEDTQLAPCTIRAWCGDESAVHNFEVLFCSLDIGYFLPSDWLKDNFLTLSRYRRIPPDSIINVKWYAQNGEGIALHVYTTLLQDDGQRGTYQFVYSGNGLVSHYSGVMEEIIPLSQVYERIKSAFRQTAPTLQSVTIRCADRMVTYFIDPALSEVVPLWYTNCFNVPEALYLPRVTKEKITCDRSVASVGRQSQFYDITTSKEYEVESGPLTSDECQQVEQMLTSANVRIPWGNDTLPDETDFNVFMPILITDFTSELSDGNEKPNTVKFTWRFADNRPKVVAPQSPGIFNSKFDPKFS